MGNIDKFVQLKMQRFKKGDRQMIMLQAIDISSSILYDNAKAQQEFHQMTNACVSHEMRNPLNSINAINIMKKTLYKKIDKEL